LADALGSDQAVTGLVELYTALDAPASLRELGLAERDLPAAARLVAAAAPPSNPRPVDVTAAEQLLQQAWAGTRPTATDRTETSSS
jgi:maleylacetate reductase